MDGKAWETKFSWEGEEGIEVWEAEEGLGVGEDAVQDGAEHLDCLMQWVKWEGGVSTEEMIKIWMSGFRMAREIDWEREGVEMK